MKIGCAVWNLTKSHYKAPYDEQIDVIGKLGFDGIELIVFDDNDLDNYWTGSKIKEVRKRLQDNGLELSELACFDNAVHDLASRDPKKKRHALDNFRRCSAIAAEIGTRNINFVSQWAHEITGPIPYPPHAYYLDPKNIPAFDPKNTLIISDDFNWDEIWKNYVDSIKNCCKIAKEFNLRLAIEGHTHVIVPNTDSMLRLIDWVQEDNLGVNLDTGWHFVQREYIPMSVKKLGKHIFNVHTRDGDGILTYGLPPGSGIINWDEVIKELKRIKYDGYLSLEMTRYQDPERYLKIAMRYLKETLQRFE